MGHKTNFLGCGRARWGVAGVNTPVGANVPTSPKRFADVGIFAPTLTRIISQYFWYGSALSASLPITSADVKVLPPKLRCLKFIDKFYVFFKYRLKFIDKFYVFF